MYSARCCSPVEPRVSCLVREAVSWESAIKETSNYWQPGIITYTLSLSFCLNSLLNLKLQLTNVNVSFYTSVKQGSIHTSLLAHNVGKALSVMRGTVTLLMTLTYSTKRQNLFFEIPKISRDFYILQMHNSNRLSLYEVLVLVGCSLGDWNVNGVSAVRVAASVRGLWWIHPEDDTRWLSGIRSCRHVLQTNYFTGLCRCIFTYEQCCLCQVDSFFADVEFF